MAHPFYTDEHDAFRTVLRSFVANEVTPHVNEWDEAEAFPRELYQQVAQLGALGIGFEESYGGLGIHDPFLLLILAEEFARCGAGGIPASLLSSYIGAPPIQNAGTDEAKREILPGVLSGELISALAITEPGAGSDVANISTTAVRDGDEYIINGEKTFITSGMRADYITSAVRTGGPGATGVSLIVIPAHLPGLERTELKKMGWWASDTASLFFSDMRVPAKYLLGEENRGFNVVMQNFNFERLFMIAGMNGASRLLFEEAVAYAKERSTFGKPLSKHQVIQHKLVEMDRQINATQAWLEMLCWDISQGGTPVTQLAECKVQASLTMEFCAREAAQVLGGASFLRGSPVERLYREVRVNAIGGGSEEIMRNLAASQLGF